MYSTNRRTSGPAYDLPHGAQRPATPTLPYGTAHAFSSSSTNLGPSAAYPVDYTQSEMHRTSANVRSGSSTNAPPPFPSSPNSLSLYPTSPSTLELPFAARPRVHSTNSMLPGPPSATAASSHDRYNHPLPLPSAPPPPPPRPYANPPAYATGGNGSPGSATRFAFPEPQPYPGSTSTPSPYYTNGSASTLNLGAPPHNPTLSPPPHNLRHRHSRSDVTVTSPISPTTPKTASSTTFGGSPVGNGGGSSRRDYFPFHRNNPSVASFASSYRANAEDDNYYGAFGDNYEDDPATGELAKGLSDLSLQSEEGLRKFQAGELKDEDQEWYRLVPPEAREALGKEEVQRQSVLFEVVKSEREYVADLEAVHQVFIEGLRQANPPIIPPKVFAGFITQVFGNLQEILGYHKQILAALFERQREQHPLVQSISDIILDTTLKANFRSAYETYIKHYPLAESHHRKQLKQNRSYETFIQSVSSDPRIRKRDLITFLSRPVTRLPRLNLLLEQILKLTEKNEEFKDHPDVETLPMILGILKDTIKSTQPGIEAAESKVKFWALCESLVYQKGEIIDMDLYDESRTLVYLGPVYRRSRSADSQAGFSSGGWTELVAALLDNYFILTREEKRPNGTIRRLLVSRPLHLSFLRLASFKDPAEIKKERSEEGGLLDSFRHQHVPVYPFTIYHAVDRMARRYTLYATTEAVRKKWYSSFVNAIGVHKVRQEANMWFNPQTLNDGFFRVSIREPEGRLPVSKHTGRITCAVPFHNANKRFLAVGCTPGVYVAPANSESFKWVLNHRNPTSVLAYTTLDRKTFHRFVVHVDSSILSYSLDILARLALGQSTPQLLEASLERVGGVDNNVAFCRQTHLSGKALLIYASKKRLSSSMAMHVLEAVDAEEATSTKTRKSGMKYFKPLGEAGYVPKDAYDISPLSKTIGICTLGGVITADPINLASSSISVVPNLSNPNDSPALYALKVKLEGKKPLGLIRVDGSELLVIFDEVGCYIDNYGTPTRRSAFIKWDIKATSWAHRSSQLLLFSSDFIEVRSITTARIVQVLEGKDIRLLYAGPTIGLQSKDDPILVAMRGAKGDGKETVSDKIVELIETEEIGVLFSPTSGTPPASATMPLIPLGASSSASSTSSSVTLHSATGGSTGIPASVWEEWDM